jgi:hypothetical protein
LETAVVIRSTSKAGCEKEIDVVMDSVIAKDLYKMKDGVLAHNLYNSEFTGSGYNMIAQNMKLNGKMRVFIDNEKRWAYVNPLVEKEYAETMKDMMDRKKYVGLKDNKHKIYGIVSDTKKFKLYDDRQGKGRKGKVCEDAGFKVTDLRDIFHHIHHLPYDDEMKEELKDIYAMDKEDLIDILKLDEDVKRSKYYSSLEEMSQEDLTKVYTLFNMKKGELCTSLERWFSGDNPEKEILIVRE